MSKKNMSGLDWIAVGLLVVTVIAFIAWVLGG